MNLAQPNDAESAQSSRYSGHRGRQEERYCTRDCIVRARCRAILQLIDKISQFLSRDFHFGFPAGFSIPIRVTRLPATLIVGGRLTGKQA